jgi:hypothetical protein
VAKVDLDNFYHRLTLPMWMRPYFALPPVRAGLVGLAALHGADTLVYPCCTTLPMGWSHSVYLAQTAHEHILDTCTSLKAEDRITAHTDCRIDRARHHVYIDDLNLFGHDPDELAQLQDEYVRVVQQHGLPVKPSKVIRPSSHGVQCVGLMVHGVEHTVGVSVDKLQQLCSHTLALIRRGHCTGHELSSLVGRWTWACLASRPSLSVFNAVYRFVECARWRVFEVWHSVEHELLTIVGLAPLLFATLDSQWFPRVVATDASESGQGVVVTRLAPSVIAALASVSLSPGDRPESLPPELDHAPWATIISSPWQSPEHINVLEVRAVSSAVRWVLSHPSSIRRRLLLLCDSQVTVCSLTKGRSSSRLLLPRLRQIAALVLASGIRLTLQWIPTELNPADGPSRAYQHTV